jgi:precorrin-3B synthase
MSAPVIKGPVIKGPVIKGPVIKGWCPGALRPMEAGDGWLVRVRPPGGRLTAQQATGLARASLAHGNGVIDLSSRANVQLRGVRLAAHAALVTDLRALGLVDESVQAEAARNIIVTPFWMAGDGHQDIAAALVRAIADGRAPALPGKFGFSVDLAKGTVLRDAPADIRVEWHFDGWLVRGEGFVTGALVKTPDEAVDAAMALARWFVASDGAKDGRGRMPDLKASYLPERFRMFGAMTWAPRRPTPGLYPTGWLVGFAFGQMRAETLSALAMLGALRTTPWRMLLIEDLLTAPDLPDLITSPSNPLLHVSACTGAPGCQQGLGATRALARSLAPLVSLGQHLHVSGCTKGCAHPGMADVTVVATPNGYNLIRGGKASDVPHLTDIARNMIAAELAKAPHAAPL